jgi:hypothetical protein
MSVQYPPGMIVASNDILLAFRQAVSPFNLREKEIKDIVDGIIVIMLDDFYNFTTRLQREPNFTRMYPNPTLVSSQNRMLLAEATQILGYALYDRLEHLGAFSIHRTPGGLGYFPFYSEGLVRDDIILKYCAPSES